MTDRSKFEEMLERLVNEDRAGAEELFHEIVVEKSREIYQSILESDYEDDEEVEEASDEDDEDAVDEAEEDDGDELEEMFGLEDGYEMEAPMGGDPTDDMMGDVAADDGMDDMDDMGGDDMGGDDMDGDVEGRVQDLEDALEELKAEFDRLMADESGEDDEMEFGDEGDDEGDEDGEMNFGDDGDDDEEKAKEDFAFEAKKVADKKAADKKVKKTAGEEMREYVEKIGGSHYHQYGKMGDNGTNTKSAVAGKNDMGGTTANILRTDVEKGIEANKGQLQGNGVFKGTPKDMNTKNVNVPGGKAGVKHLKAQPKGHGAEKKGAGETADKAAGSTLNKLSGRAK
jgi:hypothetical protein